MIEPPRRRSVLGMTPRQQGPARPRREQDEHSDRDLEPCRRQGLGYREADEAHWNQRRGVAEDDPPFDMFALNERSRAVGHQLHDAVHGDGNEGIVVEEHHREQRDAARHAHDGGEDRSSQANGGEDDDLIEFQLAPREPFEQ